MKNIDKMIVGSLVLMSVFLIQTPATVVSANERDWVNSGADYNVSGSIVSGSLVVLQKYIKVNALDLLTINWKSGSTAETFYISIATSNLAINYSNLSENNNYSPNGTLSYPWYYFNNGWTGTAPKSGWIRFVNNDVAAITVWVNGPASLSQQTINITITPDPNSPESRIKALEDRCEFLNTTLNNLNNTVKTQGQMIGWNFDNISAQYRLILDLQNITNGLNTSLAENISRLEADFGQKLSELNASLSQSIWELNDSVVDQVAGLKADIALLSDLIGTLNATESADILELQANLDVMNASLSEADTALQTLMALNDTELSDLYSILNGSLGDLWDRFMNQKVEENLTSKINELRVLYDELNNMSYLNDTIQFEMVNKALENITKLKDQLSAMQANNTALLSDIDALRIQVESLPSLTNNTVYSNKTTTVSEDASPAIAAGVVSGALVGAITSIVAAIVISRRTQPPLTSVTPPEPMTHDGVQQKPLSSKDAEGELELDEK